MGEVDGRREEGGSGGRERTEEGRGKRLRKLRPLVNQCLLDHWKEKTFSYLSKGVLNNQILCAPQR